MCCTGASDLMPSGVTNSVSESEAPEKKSETGEGNHGFETFYYAQPCVGGWGVS